MRIRRSLAGGLVQPRRRACAGTSPAANTGARRGVVLFTVIAVLAVGMVLLGLVMRSLVREHQQCRLRHDDRQCHRLAAAGIELAQVKLKQDPKYEGEEWDIPGIEMHRRLSHAIVTIRVTNNEDGSRELVAIAEHWRLNKPRVRHTERLKIK